jgi:hypothetical protein
VSIAKELGTALFLCAVFGLAFALAGCGPIGPLSGGKLDGPVNARSVADWSFTAAHETVQLETNPREPHSVNTWCIGIGDRLYVPTSMIRGPKTPSERDWVKNVGADPQLRIRIGDEIYERVAVRVSDGAEYDAARAALEKKYQLDPAERDPEREIWIFRLDPRGA